MAFNLKNLEQMPRSTTGNNFKYVTDDDRYTVSQAGYFDLSSVTLNNPGNATINCLCPNHSFVAIVSSDGDCLVKLADRTYQYFTADTIADVTASGYFAGKNYSFDADESIKVQASDGPYEVQLVGGVASVVSGPNYAENKMASAFSGVPRLSFAGDSITANGVFITGRSEQWRCVGWVAWMRRILGDKIYADPTDNFAVPSMTTDHLIETQLPQVLTSGCDINLMMMGNNDAYGVVDTIANYETYFDALENAGIVCVALPVMPHSSPESYDANRQAQVALMNTYLRNRAETRKHFYYVDTLSEITDFSTGDAITGFHRDGVHNTIEGAKLVGRIVADTISPLLIGGALRTQMLTANQYDATYNPNGNILSNPTLTGTGGNVTNGATGDVADDWNVWRRSSAVNLTVTCSKSTLPGYTNMATQRVTLGGSGDAGSDNYVIILPDSPSIPADWVEGDVVEASVWIRTNGVSDIRGILLHAQLGDTVSFYDGAAYNGTLADGGTHETDGLYLYKTRFTIGAGSNFFWRIYIYPVAGAAMSCDFDIAQPVLRKIS